MSKIRRLTPEQIARFPEFVERWTKIGLCTDPADRKMAEEAIGKMYHAGGLPPPAKIVWCGSPFSQGLVRTILQLTNAKIGAHVKGNVKGNVLNSVKGSVLNSVLDSVWGNVRGNVLNSVKGNVLDSALDSVWDNVRGGVLDSVWGNVRGNVLDSALDSALGSVLDSVLDSVRASAWGSVLDSVLDSVYGQHEAAWLAFYHYMFEVLGLTKQTKKLDGLWQLAQSANWALPHQNICWVSERHHILQRDANGRLHCVSGPALAYPDGFEIHAIHGVRVPRFIVEQPKLITVPSIQKEANAEIRRVMIERYALDRPVRGAAAYMLDSGGKRLNHEEGIGTLWRQEVSNDEPITMIEVINSTKEPDGTFKHYWLRVPPTIQTAKEAVAWAFGMDKKDHRQRIET